MFVCAERCNLQGRKARLMGLSLSEYTRHILWRAVGELAADWQGEESCRVPARGVCAGTNAR